MNGVAIRKDGKTLGIPAGKLVEDIYMKGSTIVVEHGYDYEPYVPELDSFFQDSEKILEMRIDRSHDIEHLESYDGILLVDPDHSGQEIEKEDFPQWFWDHFSVTVKCDWEVTKIPCDLGQYGDQLVLEWEYVGES